MTSWMCRLVLSALSLTCFVLAGTSLVAAQPGDLKTTAKQYVADGLKAQAAGRYDEAISLYNKAYELVPHPELLFNLGQAHRLKGEKEIALNYYQKYLAVDSKGRGVAEASQWATQIDLELKAETEALRQAEEDRKAAAEVERKAVIEQKAKEEEQRRARATRDKARSSRAMVIRNDGAGNQAEVLQIEGTISDAGDRSTPRRTWIYVAGAASFVTLGMALGFELVGQRKYGEYEDDPANRDLLSGARGMHKVAIGSAVLGGGLAALTGYLWFTRPAPGATQAHLSVAAEMVGISVQGGF